MKNMDTVVINVSGRKFEISSDTFEKLPVEFTSRFDMAECGYKKDKRLYFFERHPDVFQYVLYHHQFGELHMPRAICPSLFRKEMAFWGIDVSRLENCCLDVYGMSFENLRRLDDFERDYEVKTDRSRIESPQTKWSRVQKAMWEILDNPFASKVSEVFYWSSITFVLLSIFALTVATHPLFKTTVRIDGSYTGGGHLEWMAEWIGTESHTGEYAGFIMEPGEDYEMAFGSSYFNDTDLNATYFSGGSSSSSGSSASALRKKEEIALLEFICFVFFTVELSLKLVFCPRLKVFFSSPLNLVDLLAIFPLYILLALHHFVESRELLGRVAEVFEGIAVLRVFRLLRLARRIRGLRVLLYAVKSGLRDVLLLGLMLFMATIIFASLMYYVDTRKEFPSIPHGLWWAIVTLTTVGYGDMTPKTAGGKLLGSLCAITGLLIVAMTVPIFVSKFLLYYNHVARKNKVTDEKLKRYEEDL